MHLIFDLNNFYFNLKNFIPYYVVGFIFLEAIYLIYLLPKVYFKEIWVNIATGGIAILIGVAVKTFFFTSLYPQVYAHRLFNLELNIYTWIFAFFIYTFIQFATHYIYHKVRIFWCLHEVHHSATQMNVTTGIRTSIFDIISLDIFYLIIPFIGIDPVVYFIFYALNKIWGTFIHINENIVSRIPYLDKLVVTPELHHIHHASNIHYLDKNYGEVVPWFDKLFKTFVRQTEQPVYGTTKITHEIGFWETQLHEFKSLWKDIKSAPNFTNKIKYIFKPPGWQPNDKTNTVRYMQRS